MKKVKTPNDDGSLLGLWELLVILSGIYAVYVIWQGTDGIIPKVLVAPLAIWVAANLYGRFTK